MREQQLHRDSADLLELTSFTLTFPTKSTSSYVALLQSRSTTQVQADGRAAYRSSGEVE